MGFRPKYPIALNKYSRVPKWQKNVALGTFDKNTKLSPLNQSDFTVYQENTQSNTKVNFS